MKLNMIFPYDCIPENSRILLYGAGNYARFLIKMNERIKWFKLCGVVDKNAENIMDFPIAVDGVEALLNRIDYDYIFISILNESVVNNVREYLSVSGVDEERVIKEKPGILYRDEYTDIIEYDVNKGKQLNNHNEIHPFIRIGYSMGYPIGDQIIALKVYQEILKLCDKVKFTIYCSNARATEAIYTGQPGLEKICDYYPDNEEIKEYDIFLFAAFIPRLKVFRRGNVKKLSEALYSSIEKLYQYQKTKSPGNGVSVYETSILMWRGKFFGKNRITMLGCDGAFDIKDSHIKLYFDESWKERFKSLRLKEPYITVHYGASDVLKNGILRTKMWPFEYYSELCGILKQKYPNVSIIQLGDTNEPKIEGVDVYLCGESLHLIKYVLKSAILHFDCESGLVHLATQLGTKCVVVFGPTPIWYFGYEQNENIPPKICGECKGLLSDWYTHCIKYDKPKCMYSITPEMVLSAMERVLLS